ncbi:MFS general substrate transporter [Coniochaeta ligniaria NRRL 30616]|uniref:MFS general substrate transporter n=1 Tax=Coniochaeta ligniaria NRRL 30616 TaxID=1408157 RepID=A0A1J7JLL5_9PEZI|nr:MFS general substrate transporter [Coniochaeta ligniaria NRRL 30616]
MSDLEAEVQPASKTENDNTPSSTSTATVKSEKSPDPKQQPPQLTDYTQRLPFAKLIAVYLCLATLFFVSFMDVNAVTTALPAIGRSLGASSTITWVGTAYLLAQCAFQVLYGRLADIFGRKGVLVGCVLALIVGDVLCGFARSGPWLYGCRAVSGIGGGGISSLVQITVSDLVSLRERGKHQGILSGAIGLGAGIGPFVAGALIEGNPERWRWAFWVPAVLAALCVPPLLALLPQKPVVGEWKTKVRNVDWIGLVTIVSGILFILIPINSGGSVLAWKSSVVIGLLTAGSILTLSFLVVEWKVARLPMMPLRLFKSLSRSTLFAQNFLFGFVWQSEVYFLPIYYQDVCGFAPIKSAYLTLPLLLAQSLAGVCSGPAMTLTSRYMPVLWVGFIFWTVGAGLKLLFNRSTSIAVYVTVVLIEGTGVGFVFQPSLVALQALSTKSELAVTTSTRNWVRALGSAVGVAVSTAVQFAVTTASLPRGLPASIGSTVRDGTWKVGDAPSWDDAILDAKLKGIHSVFVLFVPLIGLCLLGCAWIRDTTLLGDDDKGNQRVNRRLMSRLGLAG